MTRQFTRTLTTFTFSAMMLAAGPGFAQQEPPSVTLFKNVMVFDGATDGLQDLDVLVVDNKIHKVAEDIPESGTWEVETRKSSVNLSPISGGAGSGYTFIVEDDEGTQTLEITPSVIDGGGRTLMPGLIDSHTHLYLSMGGGRIGMENSRWDLFPAMGAAAAQEWLADGFTTIRDMGGMHDGLRTVIDQGLLEGPRMYLAGSTISQNSGHGDVLLAGQIDPGENNLGRLGIFVVADGPEGVRHAVRQTFGYDATIVKIMMGGGVAGAKSPMFAPQFTDEEITAAVEEATARDVYVSAHIYTDKEIQLALRLGVKTIEHGQFISEESAILLKEKGGYISPFLASIVSDEIFNHPVFGNPNSFEYPRVVAMKESAKDFVSIMQKVRPKMVFSSDIVNSSGVPARQHRDHEKWVFADKFGNFEALKAMTSVGGELALESGQSNPYPHKLGVIEKGAYADIILVDGNPLEDITVIGGNPKWFDAEPRERGIATINLIMKDGVIYKNTLN
ncbi:MAG: amidohydrolase family protein [Sedimentitalea sp.]|uniref:amidohydrolase family protein n=1 Tax=Sedimentitalea sp. TaxID=2048915 RepID=UPI00326529F4